MQRTAREKEGTRQIPVAGRDKEETSKQETRHWEKQTGYGQDPGKGIGEEGSFAGKQQDWDRGKPEQAGFGGKPEFGQTLGQTGLGQTGNLSQGGLGQTGTWESEKGSGQYSSDSGKTRDWDRERELEVDKGYKQESDSGQKTHEWQQQAPLQGQREYGESAYQQKPFQEIEQGRGRRVGFEEQPSHSDWGTTAHQEKQQKGLAGQQERQQQKGLAGQQGKQQKGLAGQQEKQTGQEKGEDLESRRQKEVDISQGSESCPKGVCPKEKEHEPCPRNEPCSTHSKQQLASKEADLSQKGGEGVLPAALGGLGGQQQKLADQEEREEEHEGKDESQEQHKMDPKLKEEIQQCKDARFTNIMTIMQKTKCKALLDSHKPLVTVSDSTSVNEALVTLIENDLSSAPILTQEGELLGFIDMLGLTKFTMCLYDKCNKQSPLEGRQQQKQLSVTRMEEWKNQTVGSLLSKDLICKEHYSLHGTSTLYEAFELMARSRHHRIALTGKRNQVIGVLTQSMILEFLYDHKKDLQGVADILVLRVRPYTYLATIKEDEPAFHAFDIMGKQHLSGMAVVDKQGKLSNGISVRDLRGVCSGSGCDFGTLLKSVGQFKKVVTKAKSEFKWTGKLVVHNEDKFETVLEKLVKLRAHRVFVVDREEKPVDVITGSSIMMMVLHCAFPPEHWGPLT